DLAIWLAYVSIPLVLGYFARQRRMPFHFLFGLFGTFILACGFTHFLEAVTFRVPVYRLSALMKIVTAVVSWATVFALVPIVPRVMARLEDPAVDAPMPAGVKSSWIGYGIAVLAAGLALSARWLLEPVLHGSYPFILPILAVVFIAWHF